MTELTGKALKARASELQIPGRSSMTADELRQAIIEADNANIDFLAPGVALKVAREADSIAPVAKPHIGRETIEVNTLTDNAALLRQATSNALGSASPMSTERRLYAYAEMNNSSVKITPKQRKRINKKANKNFAG